MSFCVALSRVYIRPKVKEKNAVRTAVSAKCSHVGEKVLGVQIVLVPTNTGKMAATFSKIHP